MPSPALEGMGGSTDNKDMIDDKFTILLVEDEDFSIEITRDFIEKRDDVFLADCVKTGREAGEVLKEKDIDIILMDIYLPDMKGIDIIDEFESLPYIIFLTSSDEHAVRAFEIGAVDYVIKPFDDERLNIALDRAIGKIRQHNKDKLFTTTTGITLKEGTKYFRIHFNKIKYLSAHDRFTVVHTEEESLKTDKYLSFYETKLPPGFYRIHKQFIVNIDFLDYIETQPGGRYLAAISGEDNLRLPVGRKYAEGLKKILGI